MTSLSLALIAMLLGSGSCSGIISPGSGGGSKDSTAVKSISLSTDKSCYHPGETVTFTSDALPSSAYVRYSHLAKTISETPLSAKSWTWVSPSVDFQGYLVQVLTKSGNTEKILGTIGVDVSSDWSKFPRYGFLASFDAMSDADISKVTAQINRYHLNGVQFQDWHWKHHRPLAGTVANPSETWTDIANRNTSKSTIDSYISSLHKYGIKVTFYDLCFGALSDAAEDGVEESWYLFNDRKHSSKNVLSLPKPMFKSDIFIVDPSNAGWQRFFSQRVDDVYSVFDFDGFQIDQLGSRGTVYSYDGSNVDLPSGFASFIQAMKSRQPAKSLVMNSVSRFGDKEIAETGKVDFLYNEVWKEDSDFSDLKDIIVRNNSFGNGNLKTVFAAYMNYDTANSIGYFNTPGVLLTDAVMFALGGDHLELGDHMLGKEYFPNTNLKMDAELQTKIVTFYDFITAYQNLLRDGISFSEESEIELSCLNGKMTLANWPPSSGNVCVLATNKDNTQILHLINLAKADYMSWRDLDATMPEPALVELPSLKFKTSKKVSAIWMASPDIDGGVPKRVTFNQSASSVTFTLPSLKYWDMVIIEYQ